MVCRFVENCYNKSVNSWSEGKDYDVDCIIVWCLWDMFIRQFVCVTMLFSYHRGRLFNSYFNSPHTFSFLVVGPIKYRANRSIGPHIKDRLWLALRSYLLWSTVTFFRYGFTVWRIKKWQPLIHTLKYSKTSWLTIFSTESQSNGSLLFPTSYFSFHLNHLSSCMLSCLTSSVTETHQLVIFINLSENQVLITTRLSLPLHYLESSWDFILQKNIVYHLLVIKRLVKTKK